MNQHGCYNSTLAGPIVIPGPMMYSNISILYMDCTFVIREVAIQGLEIMVNWPIA